MTDEHAHCWHTPNATFTIAFYPPQHNEVCCHCGAARTVVEKLPDPPAGHGKFYPRAVGGTYTR